MRGIVCLLALVAIVGIWPPAHASAAVVDTVQFIPDSAGVVHEVHTPVVVPDYQLGVANFGGANGFGVVNGIILDQRFRGPRLEIRRGPFGGFRVIRGR